ncbi:hypothetical protein [Jidongwangia harbinensis]|uniref:hypothetical protein n=1 Tax=Jidongwangia harbinensis TaxID=2878561 RepID=UPI001CDA126E|nr:hypothetical protein [Jidongwangia harbinensis]MCA2218167.1 hypothetical protein [Jidongwangia harbinensis]
MPLAPLAASVPAASGAAQPVSALRIAAWQVAVVLGFIAAGRGWAVGVTIGFAAAALLALSAVRIRGTWLSAWAGHWALFMVRRRVHDGTCLPLPAGTAIAPDGVLVGAGGLAVVARTRRWEIPALEADARGPGLDLQLVMHGGARLAEPAAWLAVGVRRDADAPDDETLRVTLGNALRRLRRSGREIGVLSSPDLRSTLAHLAHAGPSRETWRYWQSGPVTQVTLRLGLAAGPSPALRHLLVGAGDATVTAAVRAGGDGVLRVAAASPDAADRAVARLVDLGAHLGVRLHRLDGRHGPAVTASLPIGGTRR